MKHFKKILRTIGHRDSRIKQDWLDHYDADVLERIQIPDITLVNFLQSAVERNKKGPAFIYFGKKISYFHFYSMVQRFAAGLQNQGIEKGDRVALVLPNIPQFMIAYWAVLYAGAIVVPVNPLLSEREIAFQIERVDAKVIVTIDRIYDRCQKLNTGVRRVIIALVEAYMPPFTSFAFQFKKYITQQHQKILNQPGLIFFRRLFEPAPLERPVVCRPDDTAVLLFTSATTGDPKAVRLSHKNLVANTLQARAWMPDLIETREVFLAVLPFVHSYGMTACHHLCICTGSTMVLEPRFIVPRIVNNLKRYKVTIFPGVPTMYSALLGRMRKSPAKLKLKTCVCGGAPLPIKVKAEFDRITGARLVEGYGLTEASPITHCNPLNGETREGSIGLPWPNTEARIVDVKNGRILKAEKIGELQVRGPQVMTGYYRNHAATQEVLSPDGWLSTGDMAKYDHDGYFYIVDRKKDIIFAGAHNIYPAEVEKVLLEHPDVREAAVVGIPDVYYGEKVKAFVVPAAEAELAAEQLLSFCTGKLAKFKIPKEIQFKDALPRNFLGKVLKKNLRK